MGAFNEWARGGPFERPENRKVADVAQAIDLTSRMRMSPST